MVGNGFLGTLDQEGLGIQKEVQFFRGIVLYLLVRIDNPEFHQFVPQEAAGFVMDIQNAAIVDGFPAVQSIN